MRICLSLRCCWLAHCLVEGVSKTWSDLKHTLSQEICNRAEELQMYPFPPVICLHMTAVPALSSLTLKCSLWWRFVLSWYRADFAFGGSIPCCRDIHKEDGFILAFIPLGPGALHTGAQSGKSTTSFNFQLRSTSHERLGFFGEVKLF